MQTIAPRSKASIYADRGHILAEACGALPDGTPPTRFCAIYADGQLPGRGMPRPYQMVNSVFGAVQLNAFANSGIFEIGPITRYRDGECGSVATIKRTVSG